MDIDVVEGDITQQNVDAIVNAANQTLLGGGGVDGAIHRAAGPDLRTACASLGGCPTGEARITAGYRLPARFIIHTVGPIWRGGGNGEPELLRNCYLNSLALANENHLASMAFPSISTGAYAYPLQFAAQIAVQSVSDFAETGSSITLVRFVCFGQVSFETYRRIVGHRAEG